MNELRQQVYRFFDLPYVKKMEIVRKFGLLDDSELDLPEIERWKLCLARAKERGQWPDVYTEIQRLHASMGSD